MVVLRKLITCNIVDYGYGRTDNTISHPKGNTEQYKVKKSKITPFKRKARLRPGFLSTKELETKHPNLSWEWHVDVYDK